MATGKLAAKIDLQQVRNLANGVDIQSAGGKPLEVVEWKDNSLVFHSPARALEGQLVFLRGQITMNERSHPFDATGKIASIAPDGEKFNRFEVQLQQYDKSLWQKFLTTLCGQQDNADKIFSSIRGEE